MKDCPFCNIVSGDIPSYKIRENEEFEAILDICPNREGQTLVIPKKHYESDLFLIDEPGFYERYLQAGKAVVELLKKNLNVERVALVVEGLMVNHVHLRLYPLYPNTYLSIDNGEKADDEQLAKVQQLFTWKEKNN